MELIRISKPHRNRKISHAKEKQIVKDYFIENLTPEKISEKRNIDTHLVAYYIRQWRVKGEVIRKINRIHKPEDEKMLMIVDSKDIEFLSFLLAEYQMNFSIPQYYKFEERIESSINNEEMIIKC